MYFLEQIRKQFLANAINYQQSPEGPSAVDTQETTVEGPKSHDDIINGLQQIGEDAHDTATVMDGRGSDLQYGVDKLTGEADETVPLGEERVDGLVQGPESGEEHPESEGTASMETSQDVADRNEMAGTGDEEPAAGKNGEEESVQEPSPEEIARRQESLLADQARTRERLNNTQPNSPERQAIEQEMSAIQMFLNILEHGSINPPSVDPQGNPIPGSEGTNSYGGGIGQPLSAEMLAEYGGVGHELASWIQQRGFPVYEGQPNYCGKNVGECMNAFGYQGLPNSGRNGADWKTICEQRPNQFKKIDCRPEDAPAGALISYARNSGGSEARQASGHIEIALGEGRGYYYGAVASQPGGSQKPPREGSYTIFMPTSKTA